VGMRKRNGGGKWGRNKGSEIVIQFIYIGLMNKISPLE